MSLSCREARNERCFQRWRSFAVEVFTVSSSFCWVFSCSLCGRGAVNPGWRGSDVPRGFASGRRCPHPGRNCAGWERYSCPDVNIAAEYRVHCGTVAKARAWQVLKWGV
eukprot:335886-Amphidinium_carterae.1